MTPQTKRAALYVRVSTNNRATRNQAVFEQHPGVQELPSRQIWQSGAAGLLCGSTPTE
jgi:hypothetical protein